MKNEPLNLTDDNLEKDYAFEVYSQFENATAFFNDLNLTRDIKRCINFEAGNQWNMDEDIAEYPKIVLNVIKQIGKVRKSNILQNEYGFLVNSTNVKDIRKIQDFVKYLHDKMKIKKKDLKILNDNYKKGTGILYFYWDAESRNFLSKSGGKLKAEVIDVRKFRVADPYIQDLQDQEWVSYVTRERISSIKHKYGKEVPPDYEMYTKDTEKNIPTMNTNEEFANVYTKFYRNEEGQVFFVITTQTEVLKEPTPLNPFYKRPELNQEAPNTMSTMDENKNDNLLKEEVFGMYPFASLVLDERDNCFYGIPGALENIEAQKSVNQHFSVYDKGVQDIVLGGYVFKNGILGDQEITTENGQLIGLDMMPGEKIDDIFGRMPTGSIPNDSLNYSGSLLGVLKQTAGATNIQIGQSDYSGQSGKQTQMLLERAKENSSDYAMLFNEYKKEQAEIIFLFSKFYYDNEDFAIVEHGFKEDEARVYDGDKKYNGNEYLGNQMMFDVKVGPAPSFSEYANIELLGLMVQSGQAPLEVYIAGLPEGYISNKQEMLAMVQNNSKVKIEQLEQKLVQAQQVMEQMAKAFEKTKKDMNNIDNVINENQKLKSMLADLASKSIEITKQATEENRVLSSDITKILEVLQKNGKNDV